MMSSDQQLAKNITSSIFLHIHYSVNAHHTSQVLQWQAYIATLKCTQCMFVQYSTLVVALLHCMQYRKGYSTP